MGEGQGLKGFFSEFGIIPSPGITKILGPTIPTGISTIYGREGGGKTSLALWLVASAQRARDTYWIKYEPLPEVSHVENLGVDLDRLQISEPDTLQGMIPLLVSLPAKSLVVVDSIDTAKLEDRDLTCGVHGFNKELSDVLELSGKLASKGVSLLLVSQVRRRPGGVKSTLSYQESSLVSAINVSRVKTESKLGEKTWAHIQCTATRHTTWPPGNSSLIYQHPTLGICPEMELMREAQAKYGIGWRGKLNITLPMSYEEAVAVIRNDNTLFDKLWRAM